MSLGILKGARPKTRDRSNNEPKPSPAAVAAFRSKDNHQPADVLKRLRKAPRILGAREFAKLEAAAQVWTLVPAIDAVIQPYRRFFQDAGYAFQCSPDKPGFAVAPSPGTPAATRKMPPEDVLLLREIAKIYEGFAALLYQVDEILTHAQPAASGPKKPGR